MQCNILISNAILEGARCSPCAGAARLLEHLPGLSAGYYLESCPIDTCRPCASHNSCRHADPVSTVNSIVELNALYGCVEYACCWSYCSSSSCFWATRDAWYEHNWARRKAASPEETEGDARGYDQFTPMLVDTPQQISNARLHSRRAVLVGLTAVLIVGNGIAWSLLLNSKRKTGFSRLGLGMVLYIFRRHTGNVRSVAWSPDGTRTASGSDDKTVQVWDVTNGSLSFTYYGHTSSVRTVAWSPDGSRIASAGADGTVQVWDASTGRPILTSWTCWRCGSSGIVVA